MSATLAPDKILREMDALWVEMAKGNHSETGMGVLRACTMTLVVVAGESEDFQALGETLAALMPEHPARAIVVKLRRTPQPELAARVFAQCWMPFGQRRQICCEQIEVTASEVSLGDVASLLSPVLAPDLPVVLWCRSEAVTARPEFRGLAAVADKTIVDTAGWTDARAAIRRLETLSAAGTLLGDFSWTRLTRWREMLSQVFENRRNLARLPAIARVRVRFGGDQAMASALYMGAWIAAALSRPPGSLLELQADGDGPAGRLLSVELSGEGFRVEVALNGERLVTTVDALSTCTNLRRPNDYLLLREEVGIVRRDPAFDRARASAARL